MEGTASTPPSARPQAGNTTSPRFINLLSDELHQSTCKSTWYQKNLKTRKDKLKQSTISLCTTVPHLLVSSSTYSALILLKARWWFVNDGGDGEKSSCGSKVIAVCDDGRIETKKEREKKQQASAPLAAGQQQCAAPTRLNVRH